MREYDDYDDENIRLYTPVFQRVIILAAVIIAVPVLMWTITTFVRSYVARPKLPALEHVASTNMPARITANSPAPPGSAPSAADQSAPQPVGGSSASNALASPAPDTANGPPAASLRTTLAQTPSPAIAAPAATATSDASTANPGTASVGSVPRPPQVARSADNAASTSAPSSSDRGIAWPNPNTTSPPDFAATRLPPPPPPPPPARTAAAEVLPPDEPIRGPVPLPRQRPDIFAVAAAAAASGPVPMPRARPADAPAEAANTVIEPAYGYRPGLDSDR
jgi:hypothetical protein